jgi:hypothetical protein
MFTLVAVLLLASIVRCSPLATNCTSSETSASSSPSYEIIVQNGCSPSETYYHFLTNVGDTFDTVTKTQKDLNNLTEASLAPHETRTFAMIHAQEGSTFRLWWDAGKSYGSHGQTLLEVTCNPPQGVYGLQRCNLGPRSHWIPQSPGFVQKLTEFLVRLIAEQHSLNTS